MKNKEKYDLNKLKVSIQSKHLQLLDNDGKELFKTKWNSYVSLTFGILKWLEEEYTEPIQLNEDEKVILRNADKKYTWIVRDLADNLCICENLKFDVDSLVGMENFIPFSQYNHLFNFVENDKYYLIEDLLRGSEDD